MIGIDNHIEAMQVTFVAELFRDYDYTSYGRAFLNIRDEKIVPEVLDSGNEYKEVLLDDNLGGLSFFVVDNDYIPISRNNLKTKVNIYFAVNLATLYPTITERAVEHLHKDVLNILKGSKFKFTGLTAGREAFSEFDIKLGDNMQPFYLARFSTEIDWNINMCNPNHNYRITENELDRITEDDKIRMLE